MFTMVRCRLSLSVCREAASCACDEHFSEPPAPSREARRRWRRAARRVGARSRRWEPAEHHLHVAHLVDSAARPIHVRHTDADALDRCRELPELHAELSSNIGLSIVIELDPDNAYVSRCTRRVRATALSFHRSWNPGGQGCTMGSFLPVS